MRIVNKIYINKWNVKRQSPYLYSGEKHPDYFNQRYFQTNNKEGLGRSPDDKRLILGIESSFDDSCAGVVSASGKILANTKRQLNKLWGVQDAPIRAREFHQENLPLAIEEAMSQSNLASMSDLEAIAVTIGPG